MNWRSLLFVPVLAERFVAGAAQRGADAVVLDLEASVPQARKAEARDVLPDVVARLADEVAVTVRVNSWADGGPLDVEACVMPGVAALHLARCETAAEVAALDARMTELERARGLPEGAIRLVPMIESAAALTRAPEIAQAAPRVAALTLGVEDFATSMGAPPSTNLLRPAVYQLAVAARAAGCVPLAVPAGMADYRDLDTLEQAARYARGIGCTGGFAVHPGQIAVLNAVFAPTAEEIAWAQSVVAAAEAAPAEAVLKVDGQMIDAPLITRARAILQRAGAA
ncbi:MAG: CoA ester lyase [Pseudomonadota bacterium]